MGRMRAGAASTALTCGLACAASPARADSGPAAGNAFTPGGHAVTLSLASG